jgi:hypothetical protein
MDRVRVIVAADGKGGLSRPYGCARTDEEVRKLVERASLDGLLAIHTVCMASLFPPHGLMRSCASLVRQ